MYHTWLDHWDERRAQRGEEAKKTTDFCIDADLVFPNATSTTTIEEFCVLTERATASPGFFKPPTSHDLEYYREGKFLKFRSDLSTDVEENNLVWARITESGSYGKATVIFPQWNARSRNRQIAKYLSKRGVAVFEISMPYHFERSRPGADYADYILSPSLGRTIQAIRQAVWDGQKLIHWLKKEGYHEVSVIGISLGSWVAGLIAAHDPRVSKAALFLTAGSLADMVWTGRATRAIREKLEPSIGKAELRRAWAPLNLENYVYSLARADLDIQFILAKRDKVVLPELSDALIEKLSSIAARANVLKLNCGHYSLAVPPYILFAGARLKRFLAQTADPALLTDSGPI